MSLTNHALDQPLLIDPADPPARLGNQDIIFNVDADCTLTDLFWPWADATYAKRIDMQITALQRAFDPDELVPMITQRYPSHQEQIMGNEGVIITKQIAAPLDSSYDRSVLWLLVFQAEGDRLVRVDIEIEWGEPLTQRMVDGLLVAQANPEPERGLYNQQNADSTRVFGNPEGRPDQVDLDDPQRAKLTYHILVNGETEVTFLLTLSDVGEQVAWNGFLAQRDGDRTLKQSAKRWTKLLSSGCAWTPDPRRNQTARAEKITAILHTQRLQSGLAPTDRDITKIPALIDQLDLFDVTASRNLLNHLRRLAEKTNGRLPAKLPLRRKDEPTDPHAEIAATNSAYLTALHAHLSHHFSPKLLADHYPAIGLCAEMLVRFLEENGSGSHADQTSRGLGAASALAQLFNDPHNAARWGQSATNGPADPAIARASIWSDFFTLPLTVESATVRTDTGRTDTGRTDTGRSNNVWQWWALLDLPWPDPDSPAHDDRTLSLVWDGTTLHATQPVTCAAPVQLHSKIRAKNTDADAFDLTFEFEDESTDGEPIRTEFKPEF